MWLQPVMMVSIFFLAGMRAFQEQDIFNLYQPPPGAKTHSWHHQGSGVSILSRQDFISTFLANLSPGQSALLALVSKICGQWADRQGTSRGRGSHSHFCIIENKSVYIKHIIKVCVRFSWWCPGTNVITYEVRGPLKGAVLCLLKKPF